MANSRLIMIGLSALLTACTGFEQPVRPAEPAPVPSGSGASSVFRIAENDVLAGLNAPVVSGSGMVRFLDSGVLEIGNADAPHTLTVFTEYHCKYCYEFQGQYVPWIRDEFVTTGQLKIQYVIVPLQKYPNSVVAKQAVLCAGMSGSGFTMHESLTGNADRSAGAIAGRLAAMGIDSEAFGACLEGEDLQRYTAFQESVIRDLDVTLVPTFFLNGEKKTGLPSEGDFRGWIEAAVTAE